MVKNKTILTRINDEFFLIVFVLFTLITFKVVSNPQYYSSIFRTDYKAYYTGASIVRDNKIKDLYNLEIQKDYQKKILYEHTMVKTPTKGLLSYRNPPVFAVLLSPLAKLTFYQAYFVMLAFNLMITFLSIKLLWKAFDIKKPIIVWLLLYPGLLVSLISGQIASTILLLITLVLINLKKKPFVAGLLAGLVLIKPHLIILSLIFVLLTNKKGKYLSGLVLSIIVFLLINYALYGTGFFQDYTSFLLASENANLGTDIRENFNIHAIYGYVTKNNTPNIYVVIAGLGAYFGTLIALSKQRMEGVNKLAIGIIFGLSLNIHTMSADLVMMLIPLIAIYKGNETKVKWFIYILLFLIPLLGIFKIQWFATIITLAIASRLIVEMSSKTWNSSLSK